MSKAGPITVIGVAGGGRIGLMHCPRPDDAAAIRAFAPAAVLSLIADPPALPSGLSARHMLMPIVDFAAPPAGDRRWDDIAPGLHAILDAGDAVLVHCHAGLGRSGMVAARLLAERGMDPEAAIAAVRSARPGAIERPVQEAFVRAARPRSQAAGPGA